ncbi:uncharacterized protein LOC126667189 [Mercurialis annua]|uniref:uncharacterized protein LOC126667189 n=1 Tax=Mercurialis annua TaxID=3986 RepID=UPI00215FAACA|nr:uncharacterized protein LOC126667189 [Mercurialis annua]
MGSTGDSASKIKPIEETQTLNFNTQLFDSQYFTGEKGGDVNRAQLGKSTVPLYDNVSVKDAVFETQILDLCDDTQPLDDDLDILEHMDTQLIDEFFSNGGDTDKTEVLDESDQLSDGESCRRVSSSRFTSVRVAAFRASGLAARRKSGEGINSDSSLLLISNLHSEEDTIKSDGLIIREEADNGRCTDEVQGLMNGSSCNVGHSTMRKLFDKDCDDEGLASCSKILGDEEMFELPFGDDGLAGLSYIDSQEPGESSQANALACVQRLLDESKVLFDNEFDLRKSSTGKSNIISIAKGPQSLAKKTTDRINQKKRIFEWDDAQEDEGGGDIFRRRKEEFLGIQRSLPKPQRAKGNHTDGCRDKIGNLNVQNEKTVHSDSKMVLHKLKLDGKTLPEAEINIRKNLVNEFDEESNQETLAGRLKAAVTRKDMPEVLSVGLDTQMAAEAMEALVNGDGISNSDGDDVLGNSEDTLKGLQGRKGKKNSRSMRQSVDGDYDIGVSTRQSRKTKSSKQRSTSYQKDYETARIECDMNLVMTRSKRANLDAELSRTNIVKKVRSKTARQTKSVLLDEVDGCHKTVLGGSKSAKRQKLVERHASSVPVARRTRQTLFTSQDTAAEIAFNDCGQEKNCIVDVGAIEETKAGTSVETAKVLEGKRKSSDVVFTQFGELETSTSKMTAMNSGFSCPRRRRSSQRLSGPPTGTCNLDAQFKLSDQPVNIKKSAPLNKRSRSTAKIIMLSELRAKRKTRSSTTVYPDMPCPNFNGELPAETLDKSGLGGVSRNCPSPCGTMVSKDEIAEKKVKQPARQISDYEVHADNLPKEATEPSKSNCVSPVNLTRLVNDASPICISDETLKRSCKKSTCKLSLVREINSLYSTELEYSSQSKELRRRRDLASVRVLFSHHLDEDTIKQQRKILDRLKVPIASSIADATHFIADEFVRTRNMLEAIASGKLVVTHLWLENVGRAKYYIDEQKYILRDSKKEKEIGFNLPVSLEHARQHPLLEGRRVLITPKIKPGKEIISGLVKSVSGQALERVGRSSLKDDTIPDDLLILSCEEDYEVCIPFLEKGAAVYSSELLLNGIVTQKLEYERHQLFADHVKRTRSTIWLKQDDGRFSPVIKPK